MAWHSVSCDTILGTASLSAEPIGKSKMEQKSDLYSSDPVKHIIPP